MIKNYLLTFNSEIDGYTAPDTLIRYLDERYPDWRNLITSPEEFIEFFKTDVHIFQNGWLRTLADEIFDVVNNPALVESVWKDTTFNKWYRYAAIKKLITLAPNNYLTEYITELMSNGFNLGGSGYLMISELYDFPNSVKIVLDSNKYDDYNFEFLAENASEHWQEYPLDLRTRILQNRNYFMLKNGRQSMWNVMTLEEKLYLSNVIIANEYAKFHDVITFANFLTDHDENKIVLFTTEFSHEIEEIIRHEDRERFHRRFPRENAFDCPRYDALRQYIPSELITRFLALAETDTNDMVYKLLKSTIISLTSVNDGDT